MKKKSVWLLVGGLLLEGFAIHNLARRPVGQTHDVFVWYLGINLLIAAAGLWLAISYLVRSN